MSKRCMTAAVSAIAMALAPVAAGAQGGFDEFIVGGKKAEAGELPWQVALIGGNDAETARHQFCGGSIIADQWVLTAAHCVDNGLVQKDPKRLDVVAGTLTKATGGQRVDVTEIIVHPKWGATGTQYDFDAALLKLATPLTMGKKIATANAKAELPEGFTIRVSGWGATLEGGAGSPDLLYVDVPAVSNDTCNKPESYDGGISAQMLCAGLVEGGKDSCQGDSGGPAVAKLDAATSEDFTLVGVVSWGFGCARPKLYGVYTRVSTIADWLGEHTAKY